MTTTDSQARSCISCGAEFASDACFCGVCGAARGAGASRSAWRGFRAQPVWIQVVAWMFFGLGVVLLWIWSGSGWHVTGKIAVTVGAPVLLGFELLLAYGTSG